MTGDALQDGLYLPAAVLNSGAGAAEIGLYCVARRLMREQGTAPAKELASRAQMSRNTASKYVATLVARGLMQRDGRSRYAFGVSESSKSEQSAEISQHLESSKSEQTAPFSAQKVRTSETNAQKVSTDAESGSRVLDSIQDNTDSDSDSADAQKVIAAAQRVWPAGLQPRWAAVLTDLRVTYGLPRVLAALELAAQRHARSVHFVEAVCRNSVREGKSAADILAPREHRESAQPVTGRPPAGRLMTDDELRQHPIYGPFLKNMDKRLGVSSQ